MTVAWPTTLPLPTRTAYDIAPQDGVIRTEMESGPARHRQRFTQVQTDISVQWIFSQLEFLVFEAWFEHEAKRGAQFFTVTLLGGIGMAQHSARFRGPFKARPRGQEWIVSATLEIRERPTLGADQLSVVALYGPDDFMESAQIWHRFVHVDLPRS